LRTPRLRLLVVALGAAVLAGALAQSSFAITWCYDWVANEINGHHDVNRENADTLRSLLCKRGYNQVLSLTATSSSPRPGPQDIRLQVGQLPPPAPQLPAALEPGDVLIVGGSHAGIVNRDGRLDHFLQDPKATGTAYTPVQVATQPNYYVGPVRSWTLQQLFAASRDKPPAYSEDYDYHKWLEWLGRRVKGAPQQYPFLGTTAQVWRAGTGPAEGPGCGTPPAATGTTTGATAPVPAPAGKDLTLSITFQGVSEKRDEKTDALIPPQTPTVDVQSGSRSYSGTVSVAGTVPTADSIYVVFGETIVGVLGPGGGGFSGVSEPKGFGADTSLGAFVCKQGVSVGKPVTATTGCLAEGDDVNVQWKP
jgi:hypothetical protein